ncbi:UDP-glucose 4-epimerase GalE [Streptococcus sp. 27098_8_134]|jgi:UDP-glucose 4-epimerase|uniref:UDP-glucose 4-epimerase n=2 Tax=Streptococcus sanguinis TaxID=1305 RepID=D6R2U8_STRSA|nr:MULTISPECIES: UDP-glucose 4-epimerase GalE [Streptococcus]ADG57577.1 GalE2 [Streptococcus sanguinis]AFV99165.1 UDP-glucose/UDP-N-acetylglucosamine 4-epimerase [Streptococcus sanguinis]EGJ41524.1 UDP-glucose 4-epimerase [Streptococcus sanguinis SK49]RSI42992.1 UDP-glucose 4-epimerase [Streptococcus sanguinis]RSJ39838.1 UDP-glucose 4-epimerase [Streptococcus sanguinis]
MKRILVTGGAGYIGSHTVVELIAAGYEAIIVDNFSNSSVEVLDRLKTITGVEVPFYKGSISDKDFMNRVFEENQIDAVIHFAAYKAVGESVQEPLKYYKNNVCGTISLLDVMKLHKVEHIIFSSSATVYGMNNISPLTEDLSTSATNPYGYTKLMMEQILTDVALANSDWSVTNLRYFNPIGAHESGMIGEAPNGIPNNLMPYITQVAVGKLQELSVFGNDYDTHDGTGVRDYIHVVDLAKGHVLALKHNLENKGVAVFNLGTGIGYSVLDMVKAFENVNGVKVPYAIKERRPGDVATCYADASKANDILGWKAEKTLQDMMRDSWRWQSSNPNGYES